jgi:hypothetical protein
MDVGGIVDLTPIPEMSYGEYDADYESDDGSVLGEDEGKDSTRVKQTEFSLTQFAQLMGQPNFSAFNKWKKVCMAGCLEKKDRSIIPEQNRSKQLRGGPLHWQMAVAGFFGDFTDLAAFGKFG